MFFRVIFSSPVLAGVRVIDAFTTDDALLKIKRLHSNKAVAQEMPVHYDVFVNGKKDQHLMYRLDRVRAILTVVRKSKIFGAFQKMEIRGELSCMDQYVYSKEEFDILSNLKLHIASEDPQVYESFRLLNAVEVALNYRAEGTIFN